MDLEATSITGKFHFSAARPAPTLKRRLATAHDLKPGQYRKQFDVPKDPPLAATGYVAKRRQMAVTVFIHEGKKENRGKAGKLAID